MAIPAVTPGPLLQYVEIIAIIDSQNRGSGRRYVPTRAWLLLPGIVVIASHRRESPAATYIHVASAHCAGQFAAAAAR